MKGIRILKKIIPLLGMTGIGLWYEKQIYIVKFLLLW